MWKLTFENNKNFLAVPKEIFISPEDKLVILNFENSRV